ncbi:MAG: glutathione S-transferase family protein [Boseongicola sp.]|nr:glutathione S-transferase family protein [Boseongicola sp.]
MQNTVLPKIFHVVIPGFAHSRSFRCIWLLEELGVEYEVIMVQTGVPFREQMAPYGVTRSTKIPTMLFQGREIGESGVICQVLAEEFADQRSFLGTSDERLEMLEWVAFAESCITFLIPCWPVMLRPGSTVEELTKKAFNPMRRVIGRNVEHFEAHLGARGSEFLLESGLSIADMMCGYSLHSLDNWGLIDLSEAPHVTAYLERLRQREAFKRALTCDALELGTHRRGASF